MVIKIFFCFVSLVLSRFPKCILCETIVLVARVVIVIKVEINSEMIFAAVLYLFYLVTLKMEIGYFNAVVSVHHTFIFSACEQNVYKLGKGKKVH